MILSVPSKDHIAAYPLDVRCPICNRPLQEELIEDILTVSEKGQQILSSSLWLTIWTTRLVELQGVDPAEISWNVTSGEDEIDIVVNLQGFRVFFELKDRDFGLGDAYPFAYRMETYGGQFGVIVSTGKIGKEAKEFLNRRRVGRIRMIEDAQEMEEQLREALHVASVISVMSALEDPVLRRPSEIAPVLSAWMETFEKRRASPIGTRAGRTVKAAE